MAFDNVVSILSEGVSYYLSGSTKTNYTGTGTPWTAETTTPYRLSLNDGSPIWVPQPSPARLVMSGGILVDQSYDTIVESVGVQMYANSADNAIALLRQLRQVLNTALWSLPPLLVIQGGTNTAYYEIYGADVVETASYITEGSATNIVIRATITWTRAAHGGVASLTTLQSGITVTNSGTGANNNTRALGALTGDLIYDGMPLNIKFAPASAGSRYRFTFATVYQRTYVTAISGSDTTSSTTGVPAWTDTTAALTNPARTRNGLRLKVLLRCTSISAKARVRLTITNGAGTSTFWEGPWVASPGSTGVCQIDITPQGVALDFVRRAMFESGDLSFILYIKSTDGTSITVNTHSVEYLLAYTFCRLSSGSIAISTSNSSFVAIEQAQNLNGTAYVPCIGTAQAGIDTAGTDFPYTPISKYGTLPRAISGASLYFSWTDTNGDHANTDTATVTTQLLPLYQTLRGGS